MYISDSFNMDESALLPDMPGNICKSFPLFQSYPLLSLVKPRDIEKNGDNLFMAILISNIKKGEMVHEYRNGSVVISDDAVAYRPLDRQETEPPDFPILRKIKRRTLRLRFSQNFFFVRYNLDAFLNNQERNEGILIEIEDQSEDEVHEMKNKDYSKILHYIRKSRYGDLLGNTFFYESLFKGINLHSVQESVINENETLICPFDGPVRPILITIGTPAWTWDHRCGTARTYACCPQCYGSFGTTGFIMN